MSVAALFVEPMGVYSDIPGVDPWHAARDARTYAGPHPVVAHPPCKRWGRYWSGGPSARVKRLKGDDGGCFAAALWSVRTFGGVLEHPEASAAWSWFGLRTPRRQGGWSRASEWGWTACVEQGHYGHRARKATWLYAVRTSLPKLVWGACEGKERMDDGYNSKGHRERAVASGTHAPKSKLTQAERLATPVAFRDVLIAMARSVDDGAQKVVPVAGRGLFDWMEATS